jgi:hypothetical protein
VKEQMVYKAISKAYEYSKLLIIWNNEEKKTCKYEKA